MSLDLQAATVTRPPGMRFDSGGLAKGLFGDILAGILALHESFAVDCGGDVRLGGTAATPRLVNVASPFDGSVLHSFELSAGAVATSGIGRRSWIYAGGRPAHHMLDPATGRPAFTGIVQVSAIAPSAVEAEVLAKTALLRGPARAAATLVTAASWSTHTTTGRSSCADRGAAAASRATRQQVGNRQPPGFVGSWAARQRAARLCELAMSRLR